MGRDPDELRRLARKLAALTPEERARVIAEATRDEIQFKPLPRDFKPPLLKLGGPWAGGTLRREEIYGDDAAEQGLLDTSLLVAASVEIKVGPEQRS